MLGQYYKTWDGVQCDFTGALDLYTVGSKQRMIGNYMFTCDELGCTVVGFENHSGKTYLGDGVKPIGKVLAGYGNNGEDGFEGARYKNVFATYSHGCLLPKKSADCGLCAENGAGAQIRRDGIKAAGQYARNCGARLHAEAPVGKVKTQNPSRRNWREGFFFMGYACRARQLLPAGF